MIGGQETVMSRRSRGRSETQGSRPRGDVPGVLEVDAEIVAS